MAFYPHHLQDLRRTFSYNIKSHIIYNIILTIAMAGPADDLLVGPRHAEQRCDHTGTSLGHHAGQNWLWLWARRKDDQIKLCWFKYQNRWTIWWTNFNFHQSGLKLGGAWTLDESNVPSGIKVLLILILDLMLILIPNLIFLSPLMRLTFPHSIQSFLTINDDARYCKNAIMLFTYIYMLTLCIYLGS